MSCEVADLKAQRAIEINKYISAYQSPRYAMGARRMKDALKALRNLPSGGAYLDVSCGRGEMLIAAEQMGYKPCVGTEVVPGLVDGNRVQFAEAHDLPFEDNSFVVVSFFDVIEHLMPGDDEAACRELLRVASRHVLITANNLTSRNAIGDELHINRREYSDWDSLFRQWFSGCRIVMEKELSYVSQLWRIDLP